MCWQKNVLAINDRDLMMINRLCLVTTITSMIDGAWCLQVRRLRYVERLRSDSYEYWYKRFRLHHHGLWDALHFLDSLCRLRTSALVFRMCAHSDCAAKHRDSLNLSVKGAQAIWLCGKEKVDYTVQDLP